jgi:peptidoglycan hydrolase-like protein with peptidoglycan-binding domain
MVLGYQTPGLTMSQTTTNDPAVIRELQRDLRALGFLREGIDGQFGSGTEAAIRALQYDLMNNSGATRQNDGRAPVSITAYNTTVPPITAMTGELDQALAACIAAMLADPAFPQLPNAVDPVSANTAAMQSIRGISSKTAPTPFIAAIVAQESGGQHYRVPSGADADNFVVVGLDRGNQHDADQITSRGYGIGQYTIFHHPPRPEELTSFIRNPAGNVARAFQELRDKFDSWVVGPTDTADDRKAEHPMLPLRLCRYTASDPRYMVDCRACATAARKVDIRLGTPAYAGASFGYKTDQYYPAASYVGVPDRADFGCDWPYAARRYNGSGNDSFHYQTHILLNLLAGPATTGG